MLSQKTGCIGCVWCQNIPVVNRKNGCLGCLICGQWNQSFRLKPGWTGCSHCRLSILCMKVSAKIQKVVVSVVFMVVWVVLFVHRDIKFYIYNLWIGCRCCRM